VVLHRRLPRAGDDADRSIRGDIVHVDRIWASASSRSAITARASRRSTNSWRIASEAHVAGLMTGKAGTLHLHMGDGERGLVMVREAIELTEIPARVFHPTHCNRNARCSTRRST